VVGDIRSAPHAQPRAIVYRPVKQAPPPWLYITVESGREQSGLLPAIRRAVWAVDPGQPLDGSSGPWTLHEWVSARTEQPRLVAAIGNALAAIAVVLATMGLYGLLSYTVARRTWEFGLRMALGASPGGVMRLILQRTLTLTIVGVVLGVVTASFMTRFLGGMLFGVTRLDPATFLVAALTFLAISTLATLVPVRRAMTVSPAVALRSE
jgi:putative ABC transport system permease protein